MLKRFYLKLHTFLNFRGCSALVVTLGSMLMKSISRAKDIPAVADLVSLGHTQEEVMQAVRLASYDHFTIELVDIQVQFTKLQLFYFLYEFSSLHL